MKILSEIHSGDVNNDSGLAELFIHFTPESLIHISPESLSTISRNDYSHAPEYAVSLMRWRVPGCCWGSSRRGQTDSDFQPCRFMWDAPCGRQQRGTRNPFM